MFMWLNKFGETILNKIKQQKYCQLSQNLYSWYDYRTIFLKNIWKMYGKQCWETLGHCVV